MSVTRWLFAALTTIDAFLAGILKILYEFFDETKCSMIMIIRPIYSLGRKYCEASS